MKKGFYLTRCGLTAIVARIRPVKKNKWILEGAIIVSKGLYAMSFWSIDGRHEYSKYDLVEQP